MRHYKSGTRWCVWRWTVIPRSNNYIDRLHLVQTPWFSVCLHWINEPDPEPYLHDHPVSFLSLILRGGYTENRSVLTTYDFGYSQWWDVIDRRWFNYIRATKNDAHRIISVRPNTLTLCFMGPRVRQWGFHTRNGWEFWKDYYDMEMKDRVRD